MEHSRIQSYRDLTAWKKSILLIVEIYRITRKLPDDERFGLIPQLRRAAVSVSSNIAEGHGSTHRKTFLRHLAIARGSLMETESLLYVAECLNQLSSEDLATSTKLIDEISRLITSLRRALARSQRPEPAALRRPPKP